MSSLNDQPRKLAIEANSAVAAVFKSADDVTAAVAAIVARASSVAAQFATSPRSSHLITLNELSCVLDEANKVLETAIMEQERNTCRVQLYCHHPIKGRLDVPFKIHKGVTLRQAVSMAYEEFEDLPDIGVPLDRCRLVKFNQVNDTVEYDWTGRICSWDERMDETVGGIFEAVRSSDYKFDLLLEIVPEGQAFQVYYKPVTFTVKILMVDIDAREIRKPVSIRMPFGKTVHDLKLKIKSTMNNVEDPEHIHLVYVGYRNDLRCLTQKDRSLSSEGFEMNWSWSKKVYANVFASSDEIEFLTTCKPRLYDLIDQHENAITIRITLPKVDKETLDRLGIEIAIPTISTTAVTARTASSLETEPVKYLFKIISSSEDAEGKFCTAMVSKQIPLANFKSGLEELLNVPAEILLVSKKTVTTIGPVEHEWDQPNEILGTFEFSQIAVRLGRVLGQIYQLKINDTRECSSLLFDWVFSFGVTFEQMKKDILAELKSRHGIEIPPNKCILRDKLGPTPSTVYGDKEKVWNMELFVNFSNWKTMFLQLLDVNNPHDVASNYRGAQMAIFTRRWRPSTLTLEPFVDIPLVNFNCRGLGRKLSGLSGVSPEKIEIAKAPGKFPCEGSLFSIHEYLTWTPLLTNDGEYVGDSSYQCPCCVEAYGDVIYWREKGEPLKKLTEQERREILERENADSATTGTIH